MEYVDGEPIDIYCDSRCLSVEQRLRLIEDLLQGLGGHCVHLKAQCTACPSVG